MTYSGQQDMGSLKIIIAIIYSDPQSGGWIGSINGMGAENVKKFLNLEK